MMDTMTPSDITTLADSKIGDRCSHDIAVELHTLARAIEVQINAVAPSVEMIPIVDLVESSLVVTRYRIGPCVMTFTPVDPDSGVAGGHGLDVEIKHGGIIHASHYNLPIDLNKSTMIGLLCHAIDFPDQELISLRSMLEE